MDDRQLSISPNALYARFGSEAAPIIVDVRRASDFAGAERLLVDAFHRSPDNVREWRTDFNAGACLRSRLGCRPTSPMTTKC